jgi:hypothetical protein
MNINLRAGGLVVIDVDGGDIAASVAKHGEFNITKSMNRKMPHIWKERVSDDPWSTQIKVGGDEVDYLYNNVFETIDSMITNYDPSGLDEFDWEEHIGEKPEPVAKPETNTTVKNTSVSVDQGDALLDLIHIKYWTNRNDWLNLIWACVDKFGMEAGTKIAQKYSAMVPGYENDGEDVAKVAADFRDGKVTWGTAHHYAKKSDPDGYYRLTARKIKGSDEMLAQLFMELRRNDIVSSSLGDYFVHHNNSWRKVDERKGKDFLKRLIYIDLEQEVTAASNALLKQLIEIENAHGRDCDQFTPVEDQLNELAKIKEKLERATGIDGIFNRVKGHLAMLENEIQFDTGSDQYYNIQFNNGVYELDTKTFRPRRKTDYITMKLNWDYAPDYDQDCYDEIHDYFKKIQPDEEQRHFTVGWLAQSMNGDVSGEKFKVNVGKTAGNGKSTEMINHAKVFPIYSAKLAAETFCLDYSKAHKQLYDLVHKPARFVYIEEMRQSKLDENLLKEFVTGKGFTIEIMYGTKVVVDLQGKLITCSQHDPNANIDQGLLRRGLLQEYSSRFRDEYKTDNYETHQYRRVQGWDKRFDEDKYKLAYFHYLLAHYDDFKIPEKNLNAFKETLEEYDESTQIYENHFEQTGHDKDRISKDRVMEIMAGHKITSWRTILGKMKLAGFEYSKTMRADNGKKGCFVGVKEIDEVEEAEDC